MSRRVLTADDYLFAAYLMTQGDYYFRANVTVHYNCESPGFWANYKGTNTPFYKHFEHFMQKQDWVTAPSDIRRVFAKEYLDALLNKEVSA